MKIEEGRAMAVSSKNFEEGMILPRATPARSGTRHSISVMLRRAAQARAWVRLVILPGSAGAGFFFLGMENHLGELRVLVCAIAVSNGSR